MIKALKRLINKKLFLFMLFMTIKTSRWTFLAAIIFTINTIYWYWKHPDDLVGIALYAIAAIIFYIATIGNWKSGN